jgi:hypothetical protein
MPKPKTETKADVNATSKKLTQEMSVLVACAIHDICDNRTLGNGYPTDKYTVNDMKLLKESRPTGKKAMFSFNANAKRIILHIFNRFADQMKEAGSFEKLNELINLASYVANLKVSTDSAHFEQHEDKDGFVLAEYKTRIGQIDGDFKFAEKCAETMVRFQKQLARMCAAHVWWNEGGTITESTILTVLEITELSPEEIDAAWGVCEYKTTQTMSQITKVDAATVKLD